MSRSQRKPRLRHGNEGTLAFEVFKGAGEFQTFFGI
jgi:hypothetical protein